MIARSVLTVFLILAAPGCSSGGQKHEVQLKVVDALDLPCPVGSLEEIESPSIALSLGEYESMALLLSSGLPLENAKIEVHGLPDGVEVERRQVTPHRCRLRRQREITYPYFLEQVQAASIPAGGSGVYYLTFKAKREARPDVYDLRIVVAGASVEVELTVHPYILRRDAEEFFFGAFCGGKDVNITPAHLADLKARGFDALQFFWNGLSLRLAKNNGHLKVDFSTVDRWMEDFREAGLRGPVVWSMGNDHRSHMENAISDLFGLERRKPETIARKTLDFSDIHNAELNRLLKELMLAIKSHAERQNWPEIVFIIYDEPTERLMAEHENRYKFIKSFWPELRIYGVTMDRLEWARDISHMVDIYVANGDFQRISSLGKETGKPFWLYGSASSRDAASLRHSYAWTPWAHDAESSWFWAYNYGSGDLYDDFDGRLAETSARMVWPPRAAGGPLVFSVSWDGMREAADDMAYLRTLTWMLGQSESRQAMEISRELGRMKASIPAGEMVRVLGGDEHDRVQLVESRKYVREFRKKVAARIGELLELESGLYSEIRPR